MRAARKQSGLSQTEVATDFLITRQAVSAWERAASMPTVTQLYEIGLLYGVSIDYLLYGVRVVPAGSGIVGAILSDTRSETSSQAALCGK